MEKDPKYILSIYNTVSKKYENVEVNQEVFQAYQRSGWNIKDNDQSFYDHEIQLSSLIGGENGSYENFEELIDSRYGPEVVVTKAMEMDRLYQAILSLSKADRELVWSLFFEELTERAYAEELGICRNAIHKKKRRILNCLKNFLES